MRATAVLLVFANHLFDQPTGGFVGVDVFFVLSGYLITGVLFADGARLGRPSLREFYARRARRIVPVAVLTLIVTNLVASEVFGHLRARQLRTDSVWAAVFGANIHFSDIGTDYFQRGRPPSAVQHFWSLSIEEQFYVAWPLLIIAAFVVSRRSGPRASRTIGAVAVATVAISLIYCAHLTGVSPTRAYFSTPARAWELGLGAIGFLARKVTSRVPSVVLGLVAWVGLACVAVAAVLYDSHTAFPGTAALLPTLGTLGIVMAGDPRWGPGRMGLLNNPVSQLVGELSYSIYLWHLPCIVLADAYFRTHGAGYYTSATAGPLLLSAISFYLVEDPVRRSRWLSKRSAGLPRRTAQLWVEDNARSVYGLIAIASVVVALLAVDAVQPTAAPSEAAPAVQDPSPRPPVASLTPVSDVQTAPARPPGPTSPRASTSWTGRQPRSTSTASLSTLPVTFRRVSTAAPPRRTWRSSSATRSLQAGRRG